jgi:two-component system, NarL family, invasion response regulator UvrY
MPTRDLVRNMSPAPPCSLLLVDDHPALRAGLRSLLSGDPGLLILADLSSGEEAYAWYRAHHPDVVVMDLSMEGYGGIEALRRIVQFDPQARIMIYTVHASDVMLNRALGMGALGYVTKASDVDTLISGIREVAQHRGFVSPDMIPAMVRKHTAQNQSLLEHLGAREFQILLLTGQGHKVGECAQMLNLSEKTVRNHLTRIKTRLNVADTAELTRLAIRAGLVEP